VKLLLDTNVVVRHMQGQLPSRIVRVLDKSTTEIIVSILTPWEIAMKPVLRQAGLNGRLVEDHLKRLGARVLSVTLEHTDMLYTLPEHHHDPFDHMIIAQALAEKCPVVSSDQRFPLYASAGLKVLWDD
jgi:PIN domain nuclease of toxin-antitoxin system